MTVSAKIISAAVLVVAIFASLDASAGDWSVTMDFRDPTNADVTKAARAANDEGYSLAIFRNEDGKVRWLLELPQGSFDRIVASGRVVAFRIDDLDASDIEVSNSTFLEQPKVIGRSVWDLLWHGEGASPTRGRLREILDGSTLAVRFYFDTGGSTDTTFDLSGSDESIASAIDITARADPDVTSREQERDEALLNATTVCASSSNVIHCIGKLGDCVKDTSTLTGEQLRSCMAIAGYSFQ